MDNSVFSLKSRVAWKTPFPLFVRTQIHLRFNSYSIDTKWNLINQLSPTMSFTIHNFFLTIRLWTSSTPTFENRIKLKIAKSCDLGFVTSGERFTSRACALRKTCYTVASFRARYIDANSKGGFTTSYSIEKVNVIRDPAIYGHHRSRFVLMIACNTVFAHLVNRY